MYSISVAGQHTPLNLLSVRGGFQCVNGSGNNAMKSFLKMSLCPVCILVDVFKF